MSKRILNVKEINELLGRIKRGEPKDFIENQMNISSSTISNFKGYFIAKGYDLSNDSSYKETAFSISNIVEPVLKKLDAKRVTTTKRKHTRSFQSFKNVPLKDEEVYVRINKVVHILEKKPKTMTIGPTYLNLEF